MDDDVDFAGSLGFVGFEGLADDDVLASGQEELVDGEVIVGDSGGHGDQFTDTAIRGDGVDAEEQVFLETRNVRVGKRILQSSLILLERTC